MDLQSKPHYIKNGWRLCLRLLQLRFFLNILDEKKKKKKHSSSSSRPFKLSSNLKFTNFVQFDIYNVLSVASSACSVLDLQDNKKNSSVVSLDWELLMNSVCCIVQVSNKSCPTHHQFSMRSSTLSMVASTINCKVHLFCFFLHYPSKWIWTILYL